MMDKYNVGILNFWPFKNMGGIIQAWALQNIIKSLGHSCMLLNYQIDLYQQQYKNSFVERFANKYLTVSELYPSSIALINSNSMVDTFVLGSDCIWGEWWTILDPSLIYMGSFVNPNKKIISYAPSFGNALFERSESHTQVIKYYLNKIDHISVREKSGVDILKNTFDIDGVQVLDPTLCVDAKEYDELLANSKYHNKDYVFNYSIGIKKEDAAYQKMVAKLAQENVYALSQAGLENIDVEDWLYLIKNSKLLITNSYHACCFALKFNVPFYIFSPYGLDTSRFDSLLGLLNLEDRILRSEDDVKSIKNLYSPINWKTVNSILDNEKKHSVAWLKSSLEAPKDKSRIKPIDSIIKFLYEKIVLQEQYIKLNLQSRVNYENLYNILNYKKNYRKYLKYKILKNFVWGKIKTRYKRKQHLYREKVKAVRMIRKMAL